MYRLLSHFLLRACLVALLLLVPAIGDHAKAQTGKKPNILVIWGDDIGQFNISAYNRGMMQSRTPQHRQHRQ